MSGIGKKLAYLMLGVACHHGDKRIFLAKMALKFILRKMKEF